MRTWRFKTIYLPWMQMMSNYSNGVCLCSCPACTNLGVVWTEGGPTRLCCAVIYCRLSSVSHSYAIVCCTTTAWSCGSGCSRAALWGAYKEAGGSFPKGLALVSSATALHTYQVCHWLKSSMRFVNVWICSFFEEENAHLGTAHHFQGNEFDWICLLPPFLCIQIALRIIAAP